MRLIPWIRMARLQVSLIFPAIGLAAVLVSGKPAGPWSALVPVLSIFMLSASAYMLNDVFDLEVDRISNPGRPLPSEELSSRQVQIVGCMLLLAGASLTFVYGSALSFALGLILCLMVVAYSAPPLRLRRFLIAPYVTIAASAALSFLLASSFQSPSVSPSVALACILIFGYSFGSCTVKEFKDIEGDSRTGVRSLPVALGPDRAARVTIPLYLASCLLLLPLHWLFDLSIVFPLAWGGVFAAKTKTSLDLIGDPLDMPRRMRILEVEVISTILLFLAIGLSSLG